MCAPYSQNNAMMGRVSNYSPAKQKRFEAHQASQRQKLADSGFDFNSDKATNPGWGLINIADEMKWSKKDDEKYIGSMSMPAARLSNPQVTAPVERQRDYVLNSKNNLETASNYKSKKDGSGSKKSGSKSKLRIKRNTNINTPVNSQGGINI